MKCLAWSLDHSGYYSKLYQILPLFTASPLPLPSTVLNSTVQSISLCGIYTHTFSQTLLYLVLALPHPHPPQSQVTPQPKAIGPHIPSGTRACLRKMIGETLRRKTFLIILSIMRMLELPPSFKVTQSFTLNVSRQNAHLFLKISSS